MNALTPNGEVSITVIRRVRLRNPEHAADAAFLDPQSDSFSGFLRSTKLLFKDAEGELHEETRTWILVTTPQGQYGLPEDEWEILEKRGIVSMRDV